MADRLVAVEGVVAVALGGSRARGTHRPDSDIDLGLYYRGDLDVGALRSLAAGVADDPVDVTEPGGWGPSGSDPAYTAGCLFRAVGVACHALHGHARRWLTNEKGMVASTAALPVAPPGFAEHVQSLFAAAGRTPDDGVTLHWHGYDVPCGEDGAPGVTQPAVRPGDEFGYRFRAEQAGTYW